MASRRNVPPSPGGVAGPAVSTVIPPEQAAFLVPGVSVIVASHDARMVPSVTRGVACRMSEDHTTLTVLVRRGAAATLLEDIARCRAVSSCHSLPSTHRTIQLKGRDARIEAARADDVVLAREFADAFCAQLAIFAYPEPFVRAMLFVAPEDLVAVSFSPSELYSQTPGPDAGKRVA